MLPHELVHLCRQGQGSRDVPDHRLLRRLHRLGRRRCGAAVLGRSARLGLQCNHALHHAKAKRVTLHTSADRSAKLPSNVRI